VDLENSEIQKSDKELFIGFSAIQCIQKNNVEGTSGVSIFRKEVRSFFDTPLVPSTLFFCMHCIAENPMKSSLSDFWISEFSKSTVTAKQSSTIAVGIYTSIFRKEVRSFYVGCLTYIKNKFPLNDAIIKHAVLIDPFLNRKTVSQQSLLHCDSQTIINYCSGYLHPF
jgi:hypothetical protein